MSEYRLGSSSSNILIVDDSPQNIQILTSFLKEEGYKLLVAKTGTQAIKIATERLPDLILLDVVLPEVDGFTACEILKRQEETKDIPVIFITGLTDNENIVKGFDIGGADYVTKPFDKAILLARVRTHLALYYKTKLLMCYSHMDGLTGINNRRRFDEFFQYAWQRAIKQQISLTLMFCDVDFFKAYNDYYGHLKGDDALKIIAQTIQNFIKDTSALVARYGGEEFAIILLNYTKEKVITLATMLLQEILHQEIIHEKSECSDRITISIGIGFSYPQASDNLEALFSVTDKALYQAKKSGKNRFILVEHNDH